tara:strand:- start:1332 stop:1535 length:204 start_codon:yes stop_codon:yes gene_type:complete
MGLILTFRKWFWKKVLFAWNDFFTSVDNAQMRIYLKLRKRHINVMLEAKYPVKKIKQEDYASFEEVQ